MLSRVTWQLYHNHNDSAVNCQVYIDHTHAGGSHKVDLKDCPNSTKFPHSKQCELMIIIVTLESGKSIPVVISKTLESDLNGKV